ncbi:alkylhydroperoxidase family enzyme [Pontibacter ummariensis]|uniref:Alkylhydroperoxidase family enzyme, contains CxxC motif n=1 Tax=Pontibacter ummariensis TaxID=1610492 RepID=A0A239KRU8_9BACT|nr:carboxymuconolactone decarboxylase family protein [Pontibacter ummariensis]PRY05010.1 alkylhydroperoxidase family enzyme [Pontibacter ummariensis]SNT21077.1 Alkylhydroperoxidase family enzyme, contains CxxC motif [Pontibacter ummariensis]
MKTRINLSPNGETPFQKLLGYNQDLMQKWAGLEETFFTCTGLSPELLEQVRRTLAFGNQCQYCMAKGKPKTENLNQREELASAFAELFLLDHLSINDGHFEVLREVFSDKEIVELCAFVCFITGAQRLGAVMNLTPGLKVQN